MAVSKYQMMCGHETDRLLNDKPVCPLCFGIPEAVTVVTKTPFDNRYAYCTYCKTSISSSPNLNMFEYRPHMESDKFYCGCKG